MRGKRSSASSPMEHSRKSTLYLNKNKDQAVWVSVCLLLSLNGDKKICSCLFVEVLQFEGLCRCSSDDMCMHGGRENRRRRSGLKVV